MESLFHGKFLRRKSNDARAPRPKSQEYAQFAEPHQREGSAKPIQPQYDQNGDNGCWDELIGYPVCIGGIKEGILRYYGRTKFADGLWCGVELQEPVGKNDGTVNGVRYFYCKPNHGIFAPVTKVTLLPQERLNSLIGDQNFYRPKEAAQHVSDTNFLKQSSSDPTFQKRPRASFISYIDESANFHGEKQCLKDQRVMERRHDFNYSEYALLPEKLSLAYTSNNFSQPSNTPPFDQRKQSDDKALEFFTFKEAREDYMSFPRKVMSEYSLTSHARKAALAESRSCPHSVHTFRTSDYEPVSKVMPPASAQRVLEDPRPESSFASKTCQHACRSYIPSSEFLDFQDDNDDDQMSLDYDESLGILTPSEMKDFTLCADLQTSQSDTRALDFPSSESFDEVNDLPEDEQVHDVSVQYISSSSPNFVHSVSVTQSNVPSSIFNNKHKDNHQAPGMRNLLNNTDKFLSSITSKNGTDLHFEPNLPASLKKHLSSLEQKEILTQDSVFSLNSSNVELMRGSMKKELAQKKISEEQVCTYEADRAIKGFMHLQDSESEEMNNRVDKLPRHRFEMDIKTRRNCETDSSRDSLLQNDQEQGLNKEKLTVSWEDCVTSSSEDMFNKVERPESVYTVGSNDTGYQEDGEFEQDIGMTTSVDSSEGKRFSTVSRDSCVAEEDMDGDKVAESTSTSGYSTGLSDSCCNEKHEEGSCRPMEDSYQDVADSCNSDDAIMFGHEPLRVQESDHSLGKSEGFFDMDSYRDNESTSDFHITESSTVLGLDSTCETLSETVIDDVTVVEMEDKVNTGFKVSSDQAEANKGVLQCVNKTPGMVENVTNSKPVSDNILTTSQEQRTANLYAAPKTRSEPLRDTCRDQTKRQDLKSPRRNVMSKIKAVIGGSKAKSTEGEEQTKKCTTPKKSRWEAVTSKIAASLAEEKTKPKGKKEVRSRVDTNLTAARQSCRSPRLDSSASEKADHSIGSSASSKSRKNQERSRVVVKARDTRYPAPSTGAEQCSKGPRPSRTCLSSRSTSPVAGSETSTSVSITSHQSKSKIAIWKGSNSTVGSSAAPAQVPKAPRSAVLRTTNQIHRPTNKDLSSRAMTAVKASPLSPRTSSRLDAGARSQCTRLKNGKEQGGGRPLVAPRPVRPPMWLSKAELSQEIQHLSTLCEARTKELNRLKMETRHVTKGFDALALVIGYMATELNAFKNPALATDLKEAQEKLNKEKKDLEYYEKEIEKLNAIHVKEVNEISERLNTEHEQKLQELIQKHNSQLAALKADHDKEIECHTAALQASCEEERLQHSKMLDDLQQELRKQREEMEIFHQHELDDLEEMHLEKQKSLLAEIEKLQKQCEDAKQLSLTMEDALQKDTDSKLQWLSAKRVDLQNEVDSLKAVLEIKNNELHSLRKENLEMQKELEDLPLAREKIKMLQARAEDLQALMAEKVRLERQLSTEHQAMKETYEREAKVNKRLSMENEELLWRLKQFNESSLMSTSLDECETELPQCVDLSLSCPPAVFEEVTPTATSSPRHNSAPRPVFFTYMNQEELNALSPSSPKTHYKRIQPHKSPAKPVTKSPSTQRSPRRSTDSSPHCTEGTPRKMARHVSKSARDVSQQKRDSSLEKKIKSEALLDSNLLTMPDSMVSSASSENSVFEPGFLEDNRNQVLQEPRASDVSSPCHDASSDSAKDSCGEAIDPKTYYHMTFPVKEPSNDMDLADLLKKCSQE